MQKHVLMFAVGAGVASYDKFDLEAFGLMCTWLFSFSQSVQSLYIAKRNWNNVISPFEINFFFAFVGLIVTLIYNILLSDNYEELTALA